MTSKNLGIYFDYFGTLIDSRAVLTKAWSTIAKCLGVEISPDDPRIFEGMQKQHEESLRLESLSLKTFEENSEILNSIVLENMGVDPNNSMSIVTEIFKQVFSTGSTFRLNPHCKETLEKIHSQDITIGLLSNASMELCEISMKRLGIFEFFDLFVLSREEGFDKSHIELYQIALARMHKENINKVFHVGDSRELDVIMAEQVGMIPILFDPYNLHPNEDVITINDLFKIIDYI